jgi:hypothetical protein
MPSCWCRPLLFSPVSLCLMTLIQIAEELTDSQITHSDKLSALPSRLRSSPMGRSALGPRANNSGSTIDIQDEPLTLEARYAQMSTARGQAAPPLISHSLSDSAVEIGNPLRGGISFDSERGSSTSPLPGELFPWSCGSGAEFFRLRITETRIYSLSRGAPSSWNER